MYIYLFIQGNDPAVSGNQTWVVGKSPIYRLFSTKTSIYREFSGHI